MQDPVAVIAQKPGEPEAAPYETSECKLQAEGTHKADNLLDQAEESLLRTVKPQELETDTPQRAEVTFEVNVTNEDELAEKAAAFGFASLRPLCKRLSPCFFMRLNLFHSK
ncbi:MAG: hypothetical protein GY820_20625 [Gammaproteobacteria bacterium]|nr:hypothetical protein [Gammaproteobacteria bacterium]